MEIFIICFLLGVIFFLCLGRNKPASLPEYHLKQHTPEYIHTKLVTDYFVQILQRIEYQDFVLDSDTKDEIKNILNNDSERKTKEMLELLRKTKAENIER